MGSYSPKHNTYKSDMFSLGMTLLHAARLQPLDSLYRTRQERDKLDVAALFKMLDELTYSEDFVSLLRRMLTI